MTEAGILDAVRELDGKRGCTARDVCSFLGYSTTRPAQARVRVHLEALAVKGQVSKSQDPASSGWRWGIPKGEDHEGDEDHGAEAR